jgi:preprotein translocase subunit SecF
MNTILIILGIISGVLPAGFVALRVFFYFTKKWEDKKEY